MGQSAVGNYVHQFAGKVTDDIENKVADRVATQVVDEVKNTALGALGLNSTAQLTSTLHGLLGYYLPLLGDSIASSLPQSQQQQQRTRSSTSYPTGSVSSSTTTTSSGNTQTTSSTGSTTSTASASPTAVSATASSVAMDGTEAFTNGSSSAGAMAYSNGSDTGTNGTASSVDLQALYDNFLLQQKPQQATNVQRQAEDMPSLAGDGSGARINAQRLDRPSSSRTLLEQEDPVAMGITTTAVPARGSTHSGSSNSNVNPGLGSKAAAQQTGSFMGGRLFNTQACSCPCSG
ncbi:MAG: hypothetical protein WDW36_002435 [Sanguina aurantia]